MRKNYEKKVQEAKLEIQASQTKLFKAYLDKLADLYLKVEEDRRNLLLKGLEKLIELPDDQTPNNNQVGQLEQFDGKKAKETREKLGLKSRDILETLNLDPNNVDYKSMISQYERSHKIPARKATKQQSKFTRKYLLWLKEQGYNPYNL